MHGLGSVGSKVLDKLYWDINSQLAAFVFFCSYQEYGVETTSRMCLYTNGCLLYTMLALKLNLQPNRQRPEVPVLHVQGQFSMGQAKFT